jgi:hypothetical protein
MALMAESPFLGPGGALLAYGNVFPNGQSFRLGVAATPTDTSPGEAFLTTEDGTILEGFQSVVSDPTKASRCYLLHPALGKNGFAANMFSTVPGVELSSTVANVVYSFADDSVRVTDVPAAAQNMTPPGGLYVNDTRLLWDSSGYAIFTFSLTGPSPDTKVIQKAFPGSLPAYSLGIPSPLGNAFLYRETYADPAVYSRLHIMITDGVNPGTELIPASADYDVGAPQFAGSYITWQKLIHPSSPGSAVYEHVEVWFSPFTTDPTQLQPAKLTDSLRVTEDSALTTSGFGKFAIYPQVSALPITIDVWDLATKTKISRSLPPTKTGFGYLGFTDKSLYVVGRDVPGHNTGQYLYRFSTQ